MKLDYTILWFDDQPRHVSSLKDMIKEMLREQGFRLVVESIDQDFENRVESLKTCMENYNPYDLIILDHDLGGGTIGAELAHRLRSVVYTDMIYYSGMNTQSLLGALAKAGVDGVFVTTRSTYSDDIQKIIRDQIKRVFDLNNMRGFILDAASEIEAILKQIILEKYSTCPSFTDYLKEQIENHRFVFQQQTDKTALKLTDPNADINLFLDTEHTFITFERLRQFLWDKTRNKLFKNEDVLHKVQQLRNVFAHYVSSFDQNQNRVTLKSGLNEKVFDHSKYRELRCEILELHTCLKDPGLLRTQND